MDSSTIFLLIVIFILIIIFSLLKTTCPRREQSITKLQPVPTSIIQTTTGPTQPGVQLTTPPTPQYTTPAGQGKINLFSKLIEHQTQDNNLYMDEMIKLDNSKLALYPHMPPFILDFSNYK